MGWDDRENLTDTLQRIPLIFGVVGHRDLRPEDLPALKEQLRAKIFLPYQSRYPETPIHILSALAEGADRLVANVGLECGGKCGARLIVPLPFEQSEYERDFETAESLPEFRSMLAKALRVFRIPFAEGCSTENIRDLEGPCRAKQYAEAGLFVARYSHVLIALWDGTDNHKVGGTAWVTKRREEFVRAASNRFQHADPLGYGPMLQIVTPRKSTDSVPPNAFKIIDHSRPGEKGNSYEYGSDRIYSGFNTLNQDIAARQHDEAFCTAVRKGSAKLLPLEKAKHLPPELRALQMAFSTADTLAIGYRRQARCALRLVIVFALVSGFGLEMFAHFFHPLSYMIPAGGLFSIGSFLAFVLGFAAAFCVLRHSRQRQEHDKFLNYRAVAESLRVLFFWRLAGVGDSVALQFRGRQWRELDWIRSAVHTEWILSGADLPYGMGGSAGKVDPKLQSTREHWVVHQAKYFERTGEREKTKLHQHELSVKVAIGVAIAAALWLTVLLIRDYPQIFESSPKNSESSSSLKEILEAVLLIMISGGLLVAGLFQFRAYKLALEAHARQYTEFALIFKEASKSLDTILNGYTEPRSDTTASPPAEALDRLRRLGSEALTENGDWVLTYRERPLELFLG